MVLLYSLPTEGKTYASSHPNEWLSMNKQASDTNYKSLARVVMARPELIIPKKLPILDFSRIYLIILVNLPIILPTFAFNCETRLFYRRLAIFTYKSTR